MKYYYYDGIKVKISKHTYTHGILMITSERENKIIACCGSYDLALKRLNKEVKHFNECTESHEILLQRAIEGKEDECIGLLKLNNRKELIEQIKDTIERRKKFEFKIVELEVRA